MATFTTITEHKIYTLALYSLLDLREREQERDNVMLVNCGRHSIISQARMKEIDLQVAELHDAILALEAKGEF